MGSTGAAEIETALTCWTYVTSIISITISGKMLKHFPLTKRLEATRITAIITSNQLLLDIFSTVTREK